MTKEDILQTVKALVVTRQDGMPVEDINGEYYDMEGCNIPFFNFGYHSLEEFILSDKSIKRVNNDWGTTVYLVDPKDKRMGHINKFVQQQKRNKRAKRKQSFYPDRYQKTRYNRNKRTPYYSRTNYNSDGGSSSADEDGSVDFKHPTEIIVDPTGEVGEQVHEPLALGHQLIGDDFLLQIAIRKLGAPCWRKSSKSALHCGLCISGQTIKDCIRRLENIDALSNRLVIMLGAVDIYKKTPYQQIKEDYKNLLQILEDKFGHSKQQITLCTLPPLANMSYHTANLELTNLYAINNFIRRLGNEEFMGPGLDKYNVIDVYDEMCEEGRDIIDYNNFQFDARFVSGTAQPFVLFNAEGRNKLFDLFPNACYRIPSRPTSPMWFM